MQKSDIQTLLAKLAGQIKPDQIYFDMAEFAAHLVDSRGAFHGDAAAFILPHDAEQLSQIMRFCFDHDIAMVPQGGNSGRVGGATPASNGTEVLINLKRLNRILDIDDSADTMLVEAGAILTNVQQAARDKNRLFPVSLGAEGSCQIGGNIASNAGGVQVLRYGMMRDQILGLEIVLADGQIYTDLSPLIKNNTGYDLKQLFIGSEGTLGIITKARLKLRPLPRHTHTGLLGFSSLDHLLPIYDQLKQQAGDSLQALELMSAPCFDLVKTHLPHIKLPFAAMPNWLLLIEQASFTDESGAIERAAEILLEAGLIDDALIAQNQAQCQEFWTLREAIVEAQRLEGKALKHDISVPVRHVTDFYQAASQLVWQAHSHARICAFGHVGDGNWHFNILPPLKGADDFWQDSEPLSRKIHEQALAMGGSISAEHGIGQLKQGLMLAQKGGVALGMMRAIKNTLDPKGLLNPHKLLPPSQ